MRRVVLLVAFAFAIPATPASAEVGVGLFVGEPTGLDLKLGLSRNTALDIVLGWYSHWDDRNRIDEGAYGHVTYLVTPMVTTGRSVIVPLRVGIGAAVFDDAGRFDQDLHVAARVPFQVGLMFRRSPIEIYFEIALKLTLIDPGADHRFLDLDGGIGIRFYF